MTDRRSIILLFFDLPMLTKLDRREYNKFKKQLKKNGYVGIQNSVAIKLLHNSANNKKELTKLKTVSPKQGSVFALPICIADFKKIVSLSSVMFNFNYFIDDVIYL